MVVFGRRRRLTPASHAEEDYGEEELEGAQDKGNEVVHLLPMMSGKMVAVISE